jgi:hypothetical protein
VSFHDCEVHALRLDRSGPTLELDVEVFARTAEATKWRLRFGDVSEVELAGVNEQNVVFDLIAEASDDGLWRVVVQSSYGLGGTFTCRTIESRAYLTAARCP